MTKFTKFLSDDAGAVTIDWVALTAGILLLGIMVVYAIFNDGVQSLTGNINSTLSSVSTDISVESLTFTGLAPTCPKTKKGIKCKK
jgi:hypothetical protein